MNVDGTTSHAHIQIIAVRLYNPSSRQWSIYGASAKSGVFDPPQVGQFDGNSGEFYASDTFQHSRAAQSTFVTPGTTWPRRALTLNRRSHWTVERRGRLTGFTTAVGFRPNNSGSRVV